MLPTDKGGAPFRAWWYDYRVKTGLVNVKKAQIAEDAFYAGQQVSSSARAAGIQSAPAVSAPSSSAKPLEGETPRTDAHEIEMRQRGCPMSLPDERFARQLERDLAEKTQWWENLKAALPTTRCKAGSRWQYELYYNGYWYVKKSHAEKAINEPRKT